MQGIFAELTGQVVWVAIAVAAAGIAACALVSLVPAARLRLIPTARLLAED